MSEKLISKVIEIDHHRNGMFGEPFYVVKFTSGEQNMIGVVFGLDMIIDEHGGEKPVSPWNGRVAVFDADKLAQGDITFGSNSWRGDWYESELRAAINEWHKRGDR